MFTAVQSFKNIFLCSIDTTHHFNDYIDLRVTNNIPWICCYFGRVDLNITELIGIIHRYALNEYWRAYLTAQILLISFHDTNYTCTNCSQTQQSYFNRLHLYPPKSLRI
ncbi:hypothetical protein D3C71_1685670 [compost metagenome]